MQSTNLLTDVAIEGDGFYKILLPDGTYAYTRDGSFKIDSNRELVTSQGYKVLPNILFPEEYIQNSITISEEGIVSVKIDTSNEPIELGQIEISRFINPAGLSAIGSNLFKETAGSIDTKTSGKAQEIDISLRPKIETETLEASNVNAVKEMVLMIEINRAYEANQKTIQTEDSLLGKLINEIGKY